MGGMKIDNKDHLSPADLAATSCNWSWDELGNKLAVLHSLYKILSHGALHGNTKKFSLELFKNRILWILKIVCLLNYSISIQQKIAMELFEA